VFEHSERPESFALSPLWQIQRLNTTIPMCKTPGFEPKVMDSM
jgi:hypothetical protein